MNKRRHSQASTGFAQRWSNREKCPVEDTRGLRDAVRRHLLQLQLLMPPSDIRRRQSRTDVHDANPVTPEGGQTAFVSSEIEHGHNFSVSSREVLR